MSDYLSVVILHKDGWAITNMAETKAVADVATMTRSRFVNGNEFFNFKGELKENIKADCCIKEKGKAYRGIISKVQKIDSTSEITDFVEFTVKEEIDYKETLNKIRRIK